MAFEQCPQCESPTRYRSTEDGGQSLVCSKCDWEAVTVEWFATAAEPERIRPTKLKRLKR